MITRSPSRNKKKKVQHVNKKMQKGGIRGTDINRRLRRSGNFALRALENGRITPQQIEAARKVIKRQIKKIGELFIRIRPYHTLTRKSAGIRMGKGKGKVDSLVYPIRTGKIILEIRGAFLAAIARRILARAQSKFPILTAITTLRH